MRVLVAGIGNIFLGDDGFGVEVVARLRAGGAGESADIADYGIRGLHLAYELASGRYDAAILVDAMSRGGAPGDLYAIEPEVSVTASDNPLNDAHGLTPDRVLAWVRTVESVINSAPGAGDVTGPKAPTARALTRVMVVGCEPDTVEAAIGLSPRVAAAVDPAMQMVRDLVAKVSRSPACA